MDKEREREREREKYTYIFLQVLLLHELLCIQIQNMNET